MTLTLTPKHIAFARISKYGLKFWEKPIARKEHSSWLPVEPTFVTIHDLKEKARTIDISYQFSMPPLIWEGTVGFMTLSWINNNKKIDNSKYCYKFGTGLYCDSDSLLLIDDIFEWVHNRRKIEDVRSAFDIIKSIKKGELSL